MKNKIYKKGTKIKLWCGSTRYYGVSDEEIITLDEDTDYKTLDEMSRDFMNENLSPDYGFEVEE